MTILDSTLAYYQAFFRNDPNLKDYYADHFLLQVSDANGGMTGCTKLSLFLMKGEELNKRNIRALKIEVCGNLAKVQCCSEGSVPYERRLVDEQSELYFNNRGKITKIISTIAEKTLQNTECRVDEGKENLADFEKVVRYFHACLAGPKQAAKKLRRGAAAAWKAVFGCDEKEVVEQTKELKGRKKVAEIYNDLAMATRIGQLVLTTLKIDLTSEDPQLAYSGEGEDSRVGAYSHETRERLSFDRGAVAFIEHAEENQANTE